MSTLTWIAVAVAVWAVIVVVALLWLGAAADAGERLDQVIADHCPDELEVEP